MKFLELLKKIWLVPFLALAMVACEAETADDDDDLAEFETWVDERSANVEQETEESWAETRAEFDRRTAEFDAEVNDWDDERRTRYENARTRFEDSERNARVRWDEQANVTVQYDPQMATTLIGTSDFNTITRENVAATYQAFLRKVRELDDQWTDADWEKADLVMDRLDERREEIDVKTEDSARIIAWKGEYTALKAGDDIKGN